jgi:hypothetical protein
MCRSMFWAETWMNTSAPEPDPKAVSTFDALPSTTGELTSALRTSGKLREGEIVSINVTEQHQTAISHLRFMEVVYSPASRPTPPIRLLLKWPVEPSAQPGGDAETRFYRDLAPALSSPPILRCLATAPATSAEPWLLLEDLRTSHRCPPWPDRPADSDLQEAVIVLAGLHAGWWEGQGAENPLGTPHTETSLRAMVGDVRAHLPAFLEVVADLSRADRQVLETVFNSPLRPWLRLTDQRGLTLIHGDAHTWNFLFPRSGSGMPYLIDWQTWHSDVGARDLAYMMALHWDRRVRQQLERPLLELYHRELVQRGVTMYTFEELLLDYRKCVVRNLTFPIIFWSRGFPRERWRYRLDRALAAFHDFNCTELL